MDVNEAREILLGSGGQTIRIGSPISQAIETVLAWNDRIGNLYDNLYDAREAEVLELLRERNALHRRAQQIRGGLKPYARPVEIVDYLMGEQA